MLAPFRRNSSTRSRLKNLFGLPTGKFFPDSAVNRLTHFAGVVILPVAQPASLRPLADQRSLEFGRGAQNV
jgi:hypothetical protein